MNNLNYEMIFKRKSFHLFRNIGKEKISQQELSEIEDTYQKLTPLDATITTKIKIVPASETTCKRGQEYCILFYSEKKDNYLQNIGYLGEQLDLYLASKNIGALWFGIGKPAESSFENLPFVIMIAIAKINDEKKFRKDLFKSKRKSADEIWRGETLNNVSDIVRFAPSACNTQPWFIEHIDDEIKIFRYKKAGKRGIMPATQVVYYNQIDIGIFMCFMSICLEHSNIAYNIELNIDNGSDDEMNLSAIYKIHNK
ncbi:MAG: nitroreductase family protein [Bacilli bacterium]|nr:nitroreductase family protein [Bacilli bacterium]